MSSLSTHSPLPLTSAEATLNELLAHQTIAFVTLSYNDRQLTRQFPLYSDIPLSSRTPSFLRYYRLVTRILTHIQRHHLSIPSFLSFHAMSSSSSLSCSPLPLPPDVHDSSSSTSPLLPTPLESTSDPRTLRRLRRQRDTLSTLVSSSSSSTLTPPPPPLTPRFSDLPVSNYPSPPTPPQLLPPVIPSTLNLPSPAPFVSSSSTMAPFPSTPSHIPSSASTEPYTFPPIHSTSSSLPPVTSNHPFTPITPNYPTSHSPPSLLPFHPPPPPLVPSSLPDTLQPDPTHITTDEIQRETHTSGILRTEFTNFPRIPDNQLTERLVTSLLERLAKQLSIDSSHAQNCREAQCIRMLRTSFHWRRLALWLRTYTDKSIHLSYPRTEYWTRLYDSNVHYCHQQQPEQLDLATALQRLTQNLSRPHPNHPPLLPNPSSRPPLFPPRHYPSFRTSDFYYSKPPRPTYPPFHSYSHPRFLTRTPPFSPRPLPRYPPFSHAPPVYTSRSPPSLRPSLSPPFRPTYSSSPPPRSFSSHPSNQSFSRPPSFPSNARPPYSSSFRPSPHPSSNLHTTFSFDSPSDPCDPSFHTTELPSHSPPPHSESFSPPPHSDSFSPPPDSFFPSSDSSISPDYMHDHDPLTWLHSPDMPSPYCYDSYYHDFIYSPHTYLHDSFSSPVPSHSPEYYTFDDSFASSVNHSAHSSPFQ